MVGRLVQTADFERVLKAPSRARSAHFVLHHLGSRPHRAVRPDAGNEVVPTELSTGTSSPTPPPVDDSVPTVLQAPPGQGDVWLGTVVPKRHAKRAVTRNLVKRQMRAAVERHAAGLAGGLWVLRLRLPFDRKQFSSAASDALRGAVRAELDAVLLRASQR
jgi:ribonuclease P protein component